jgi:hypothetical protein
VSIDGCIGAPLVRQGAMGFTALSRTYTKDDILVKEMLNGACDGVQVQAFSALVQLGLQTGTRQNIPIQKRDATISQEGNLAKVMISLHSGVVLRFESASMSSENLANFAKQFPTSGLDDASG